ncbi:MAG: RagB/SusD family nutrient uptake outer membrane protein [Tannerella sp.]|jgi:hypothetical protein|nr:RagB/SusD family nutrient uptake outer membrane protein [Tannerella sp.]
MNKIYKFMLPALLAALSMPSCGYLTDIDMPVDKLTKETLFTDSATVNAAVEGLYSNNLLLNPVYYYLLPFYASAMADDSYHNVTSYDVLNQNSYSPTTSFIANLWDYPYKSIYQSNALIEGLENTSVVTEAAKIRYIAQAKYFRAYSYFVLVNFFGDVPLVLMTDYKVTSLQARENVSAIYEQIIRDLKDAESGIDGNSNNKITKAAAGALLARVYLYAERWAEAEGKASEVIATSGCALESPDNVFLRSSRETIFRITSNYATYNGRVYWGTLCANRSYNFLRDELVRAFEEGDLRREKWIIARNSASAGDYHQSYKYKQTANPSDASLAEDYVVMRLSELYLILAEAQARQQKAAQAVGNLNAIRTRAGLSDLPSGLNEAQILSAVERERRAEFFLEDAHRWWDLKRTGRIDEALGQISNKSWRPHKALLPVPETELANNPNLTPNPGYGALE